MTIQGGTCPRCRAPINAGDTFCGNCGAALAAAPSRAAPPRAPAPSPPASAPPTRAPAPDPGSPAPVPWWRARLPALAGTAIAAATAVLGIVLSADGGDRATSTTPTPPAATSAATPTGTATVTPTATATDGTGGTGSGGNTLTTTLAATPEIPYTLRYPGTWNLRPISPGTGVPVVVSPVADLYSRDEYRGDLSGMFVDPRGPEAFVSLFPMGVFDRCDLTAFATCLASTGITVSDLTTTTVDGRPAVRAVGRTSDQIVSNRLVYGIEVADGLIVRLFFVASDRAFDPAQFDRIVRTLRFDPTSLEVAIATGPPPRVND